jgi:hypothetical protein
VVIFSTPEGHVKYEEKNRNKTFLKNGNIVRGSTTKNDQMKTGTKTNNKQTNSNYAT